jgi:hypothetical protein
VSVSVITVGGQSVNLVALPASPGLRSVEFMLSDSVGIVPSAFTRQSQAQEWMGADLWSWTLTLPPLSRLQEDDWACFLMEMRGMANAFQVGAPLKATAQGSVAGTPLVDNAVANGNAAMSQTLGIKGFTASAAGVLKRGDYVQNGYRLYRCLVDVNADSSGKALIPVAPSLREVPTDSSALITSNTKGLWRLAKNDRGYSTDITRLSRMSFAIQEYR